MELYHYNHNHDKLGRFTFSRFGVPSLKSKKVKTLDKNADGSKSKRNGLTEKQKKAIKIGAVAAGATIAVIGGVYLAKSGALDGFVDAGKVATNGIIDSDEKVMSISDAQESLKDIGAEKIRQKVDEIHYLSESETPKSVADAFGDLSDDNPLKKGIAVDNNCTNVFLATLARMRSLNLAPGFQKDANGDFVGVTTDNILKVFKNTTDKMGNSVLKTPRSSAVNSYDKMLSFLQKRGYPDGSIGYFKGNISVGADTYDHAVIWQLDHGKLVMGDGVNGLKAVKYLDMLTEGTTVDIFRADNLPFDMDELLKYTQKL